MFQRSDQVLTVAQMRTAEAALIATGISVDDLMQRAGRGAADFVWRLAAGRSVTVLCGPGNNGGDGYVIAEAIRERGGKVAVIAAMEPATAAAKNARALFQGKVSGPAARAGGEVFVDCLFGSGLTRSLSAAHAKLVARLAASHAKRIAIDLPSGVESNSGALLNQGLPQFDLTIALGAWKFAHLLMPANTRMGLLRLVGIGVERTPGAAIKVSQPAIAPPAAGDHKYHRGLLAVVGGAMPGAALLAAQAAQRAGAGYVKLFAHETDGAPADLVVETGPLAGVLTDHRNRAILVGPGLGRSGTARERLAIALADPVSAVLDADALTLVGANQVRSRTAATIATPHDGELAEIEKAFGCSGAGTKPERAAALAQASRMIVVAKGPDTVIASPDGRMALAERAPSWLSVAGTGDVLAGTVAARLANGSEPFAAACEGVWLHGEAARLCPPPFTAGELAEAIARAYVACL